MGKIKKMGRQRVWLIEEPRRAGKTVALGPDAVASGMPHLLPCGQNQ